MILGVDISAGWAALLVAGATVAGGFFKQALDWWASRSTVKASVKVQEATAMETVVDSVLAICKRMEQDLADCKEALVAKSKASNPDND